MANKYEDASNGCIFQWRIENVSQCWWLKDRKPIKSPSFTADGLEGTKWSCVFYFKGSEDDSYLVDDAAVKLCREPDCIGPKKIEVRFHLAFMGEGDMIWNASGDEEKFKKGDSLLGDSIEDKENVFFTEREKFIPEDTLKIQCTLWKMKEIGIVKPNYLYARTVFKNIRNLFDWRIDKFRISQSGMRKKFKNNFIEFDLVLSGDTEKKLEIKVISFNECIQYISFDTWIMDCEGKQISFGIQRYHLDDDLEKGVASTMVFFPPHLLENKHHFFPNDVLHLRFDTVLSIVENFIHSEHPVKVVGQEEHVTILIDDFKSLYNDPLFSDTELRINERTIAAHKSILSARSPVFKRMFSHDMKEKHAGCVDIEDMEYETLDRMLLFMYTGFLGDLQFESASKLYTAADRYEIMSLKNSCSAFLIDTLNLENACYVLSLADQHQDDDLKNAVQKYILENNEVFKSLEWKTFMDNNLKLAADIMYRKVNLDQF